LMDALTDTPTMGVTDSVTEDDVVLLDGEVSEPEPEPAPAPAPASTGWW
jgi:hypothetical protein